MLEVLGRIWRSPSGRLGLVATLIIVFGGLAAPLVATHMPNQIDVAARMAPPSPENIPGFCLSVRAWPVSWRVTSRSEAWCRSGR